MALRKIEIVGVATLIVLILTLLLGPNILDRFTKLKITYRIAESEIVLPDDIVEAVHSKGGLASKELPNTLYNITFSNQSSKVLEKPNFKIKAEGRIYDFKVTDTNEDIDELNATLKVEEKGVCFKLERFGPRSFIESNLWINGQLRSEPISISASNEFILESASAKEGEDRPLWRKLLSAIFWIVLFIVITGLAIAMVEPALRKMTLLQMKPIRLDKLADANHKSVFTPRDFSFAEWFDRPKIKYKRAYEEVSFLVNSLGDDVVSLNPTSEPVRCEILVGSKIQAFHLLYAYKPKNDRGSIKVEILHDDDSREIDTLYNRNYLSRVGDVVRVFTLNDSSMKGAVNYEEVSLRDTKKRTSKIVIENNQLESQFALIALTVRRA